MNAYIAIGSNLNNPLIQIQVALKHLYRLPKTKIIHISSFYQNPAVSEIRQPDFFNGVIHINTQLMPLELLRYLQHIEFTQGRLRTNFNGPRTIDLDLILFDNFYINTTELVLPHPRYHQRNFVLIPLFEIAPSLILPDGLALADKIASMNTKNLIKVELPLFSSKNLATKNIIYILGAGAIGCLFAAQLYRANIAVTLLLKNNVSLQEYQQKGGITVIEKGKKELLAIPATTIDGCLLLDTVFVTTKAFDVAPALAKVQHALHENSLIILMNNGLGCLDNHLWNFQPILAMHYCAAIRHAPFKIEVINISALYIGYSQKLPIPPVIKNLIKYFSHSTLQLQWQHNIIEKIWEKFAANCIINPLTALLKCNNGALLQHSSLISLSEKIAKEIVTLAYNKNIPLTLSTVLNFTQKVIEKTAKNYSSMLQDILQKRPTEINYLNGYICQQAQQLQISIPYNQMLTQLIFTMEQLYEKN